MCVCVCREGGGWRKGGGGGRVRASTCTCCCFRKHVQDWVNLLTLRFEKGQEVTSRRFGKRNRRKNKTKQKNNNIVVYKHLRYLVARQKFVQHPYFTGVVYDNRWESRVKWGTLMQFGTTGDAWCNGQHVCFPSLPPVLECGFEYGLGFEFSGFSMWHFLKLVVRVFFFFSGYSGFLPSFIG